MTEARRIKVNANSQRYYRKVAALRVAAGLNTRGRARVYRRWETPGLSRAARARMSRRYATVAALLDQVAALLGRAQEWLPKALRIESTALARQMATAKRFNRKRRVRIV